MVPLRVNANLKGLTLDQLVERRRTCTSPWPRTSGEAASAAAAASEAGPAAFRLRHSRATELAVPERFRAAVMWRRRRLKVETCRCRNGPAPGPRFLPFQCAQAPCPQTRALRTTSSVDR